MLCDVRCRSRFWCRVLSSLCGAELGKSCQLSLGMFGAVLGYGVGPCMGYAMLSSDLVLSWSGTRFHVLPGILLDGVRC